MSSELSREDIQWLDRVTYGPSTATVEEYRKLGRRRFLDEQLHPKDVHLPQAAADQIAALDLSHANPADLLAAVFKEQQRINALPDETQKQADRKTLNEKGNKLAYEAARREILRALYSPAQLQEQLTWFWLNHFSVFQYKANDAWLVGDYAEHAIRPLALGHFRDLVVATLTHPAMLQYLDNAQNAAGHINENYARELMELHTLGVGSGYTQQDIQELARVLTGVGVNASGNEPKLKPEWQKLYRRQGAFEFNPARHDFGSKTLLGQRIDGGGFDEVEKAVDVIVSQPACAQYVSRKLAMYFVSDNPPRSLTDRMAKTFQKTHGDIAEVLETMFKSREFTASLGAKFKDPMHFVVSTVRLAYDGKSIINTHPVVNWLNALGEPLFGRQTPDGYPLTESGWASSGQISRRFEIARAIGSGNGGLFEPEDGSPAATTGFPQLSTRLYFAAVEPFLSSNARTALEHAGSQLEWNTYLLASPDFNYR
ncbi:MAG TPA: DUF1800 domain-containing protein [Steroidobacteraceae bacterium]|nr:DUF1800 domain-containing protein [Steroidobacteraceae bacterium]